MTSRFSRVKLITFDAKDTIIKLKQSAGTFYGQTATIYGIPVSENEYKSLDQTFNSCFAEVARDHPNYGTETGLSLLKWWTLVIERGFRKANFDESRLPASTLNQVSAHAFKMFATNICWDPMDDAASALSQIRSKRPDLKIGCISNGDDRLEGLLLQLGLRHLFDFIMDSYTARCEKPSKEIFDMALDKVAGVTAETALHVGDDFNTDYQAAKTAGWSALLLATKPETKDKFTGKVPETDLITSLIEIVDEL